MLVSDMVDFKANIYKQLGASNHTDKTRDKHDYYATEPRATEKLLISLNRDGVMLPNKLWECANGEGHITRVLKTWGYDVVTSDLIDRGTIDRKLDFLALRENPYKDCGIITNPPYKQALAFVRKALELLDDGELALFHLKIQFLEGKERYEFFRKYPPKYVYVHSSRVRCAMNGDFEKYKAAAVCYCWFIFEKGFSGDPTIKWIE